ncbi:hypothetical protein DF186_15875, partial [Enterococcus hirae]
LPDDPIRLSAPDARHRAGAGRDSRTVVPPDPPDQRQRHPRLHGRAPAIADPDGADRPDAGAARAAPQPAVLAQGRRMSTGRREDLRLLSG